MGASAVNCTVAVDTMGSDLGPTEFIRGLFYAIDELKIDCQFTLVGKERLLKRLLEKNPKNIDLSKVSIHPASQVIEMDEKPIKALKQKKDSSMVRAIELLKEGKADAVVSCGNTGALMAGGTLRLRPLPGVDRPSLGTIVPGKETPFVLIDVGANPESTPQNLAHNAILGSNYAKTVLNMPQPRVGLLTIGTEEGKGNALINETHQKLQLLDGIINYQGLIEGFQLFQNKVDVVVCDGFVGNVLLKSSEAVFAFIGETMKEELVRNPKRMIGAALSKSAFRDMKNRLSPDQHAGAPLLGLKGNILKSHGSSNYVAIGNALRIASEVVRHDMIESISTEITQTNERLKNSELEQSTK